MATVHSVRYFVVLLLVGLGRIGVAQTPGQTDPTRPAPEWLAAQAPVPADEALGPASAPAGVQVIVIGPTRKFAIIDGQMVRFGQTYNGAKLVGIRPEGVVLQKDGVKEKLSMSPAVTKMVRVPNPTPGGVRSEKKAANGEGQ